MKTLKGEWRNGKYLVFRPSKRELALGMEAQRPITIPEQAKENPLGDTERVDLPWWIGD